MPLTTPVTKREVKRIVNQRQALEILGLQIPIQKPEIYKLALADLRNSVRNTERAGKRLKRNAQNVRANTRRKKSRTAGSTPETESA